MTNTETNLIQIETEKDIFRESPLRYLGYANEVGESFRYVFPNIVRPSYIVAFGYVFADTFDKTYKQYKITNQLNQDLCITSGDTLIWQTLASVLIPGYTINAVVKLAKNNLNLKLFKSNNLNKMIPSMIGLLTIPIIVHPIDHMVDQFMIMSYRKFLVGNINVKDLEQNK